MELYLFKSVRLCHYSSAARELGRAGHYSYYVKAKRRGFFTSQLCCHTQCSRKASYHQTRMLWEVSAGLKRSVLRHLLQLIGIHALGDGHDDAAVVPPGVVVRAGQCLQGHTDITAGSDEQNTHNTHMHACHTYT